MTRHQRRKAALKRKLNKARAVTNRLNSALVQERIKSNLGRAKAKERTGAGLVSSIYSGAANPLGYTNPMRYSHGPAD
jgi:hypothetical protein